MASLLSVYLDCSGTQFLWDGFLGALGFPPLTPQEVRLAKKPSVQWLEAMVQAKIVLGPFPTPILIKLIVSPLGIIPKRSPGKYLLIHHMSFPSGSSVNDSIPTDLCSVQYTSFEQVVCMVRG